LPAAAGEEKREGHDMPRAVRTIFWAGLTCGVMDISAAFLYAGSRGVQPARLLRGIASGLLGEEALHGGFWIAALGLAIHFFVAFSAAAVFYAASRKLAFLTARPVVSGILYGCAVYLVMYWIVVPLSRIHRGPVTLTSTVIAILTHMVCVGSPISLVISRFSKPAGVG
jgi:hypothetical protein